MSTSREFDYHQRAATDEYLAGWDRMYGKKPDEAPALTTKDEDELEKDK